MTEEDVRFVMQRPWVATASDGSVKAPSGDMVHPRSFGTFPRKIGLYAVREKVLPLEQAVRSASGLPADILGLTDRGYLKPGQFADVVAFNPQEIIDGATFEQPFEPPARHSVGDRQRQRGRKKRRADEVALRTRPSTCVEGHAVRNDLSAQLQ